MRLFQNLLSASHFWVNNILGRMHEYDVPSIHFYSFPHCQVRFFGESDDEACGRLREEERQKGGSGGGTQEGVVKYFYICLTREC